MIGSVVDGTHLRFNNIDLKDLKSIKLATYYANNRDYAGHVEIREGSVTGTIIGQAKLGYSKSNGKAANKYYTILVQPTSEKSPLFLVFKNEKDQAQFVAGIDWILPIYKH